MGEGGCRVGEGDVMSIAIGVGGYFGRSGDAVLVKDSILEWCGQVGADMHTNIKYRTYMHVTLVGMHV